MFRCFSGVDIALFDKFSQEKEAKYHPLTRSALSHSLVKISIAHLSDSPCNLFRQDPEVLKMMGSAVAVPLTHTLGNPFFLPMV